jgi:hypothetical protein
MARHFKRKLSENMVPVFKMVYHHFRIVGSFLHVVNIPPKKKQSDRPKWEEFNDIGGSLP